MILVTGGAGYIGSHTCVALAQSGFDFLIFDNFCNAKHSVLRKIEELGNKPIRVVEGDICDTGLLKRTIISNNVSCVIHFAALKAVGESVRKALDYYSNNVTGTISLLRAMRETGVNSLVFSSSATVYGEPVSVPIKEDSPTYAKSPYGQTKVMAEQILADMVISEPDFWRVACLRYFNPVGAHPEGKIGEDPRGSPNNLMPFLSQVATGRRKYLSIFGDDYNTQDGTGIRDYIHVMDLADGHLAALDYLNSNPSGTLLTVNLGTGRGYSVLEVLAAFEQASGKKIPYRIVERRPGDVARCYADPSRAKEMLGWQAVRGLDEMCADTWRWQSENPLGYSSGGENSLKPAPGIQNPLSVNLGIYGLYSKRPV